MVSCTNPRARGISASTLPQGTIRKGTDGKRYVVTKHGSQNVWKPVPVRAKKVRSGSSPPRSRARTTGGAGAGGSSSPRSKVLRMLGMDGPAARRATSYAGVRRSIGKHIRLQQDLEATKEDRMLLRPQVAFTNALRSQDWPIVIKMCKKGLVTESDVNALGVGHFDKTALQAASAAGHVNAVQALLSVEGILLNHQDFHGKTALHWAASNNQAAVVKALIANGAELNLRDMKGMTALHWASGIGHTTVVKALLSKADISVNLQDHAGHTALIYASQNGSTAIVKALLSVPGIQVNVRRHRRSLINTALIAASDEGHSSIVKELLSVPGIEVNLQNSHGETALHRAAFKGHLRIVKELLSVPGIEVNLQNPNGETALDKARSRNHGAVVQTLLAVV